MEDKKYWNNADEFYGAEGIQELTLDELDNIAGGRECRQSEMDDIRAVTKKVYEKFLSLDNNGKQILLDRYSAAAAKWKDDIANAVYILTFLCSFSLLSPDCIISISICK